VVKILASNPSLPYQVRDRLDPLPQGDRRIGFYSWVSYTYRLKDFTGYGQGICCARYRRKVAAVLAAE
jgi:hypothetical protein